MSAKIILHPLAPGYCQECEYYGGDDGCQNKEYGENIYNVICVWRYCKYKKLKQKGDKDGK